MKTVITSTGDRMDSEMDPRFGRCAWFCLYDHTNGQATFIKNQYKDVQGGAGNKLAEMMLNMQVDRIVSGDFGPKAKDMLDKFKIQLIKMHDDHKTMQEIISMFK